MPKQLRLLLFDANIIIFLHECGLWNAILDVCDVWVAETVKAESDFYVDPATGDKIAIDLSKERRISVVSIGVSEVATLTDKFKPAFLDDMDPGETESLAYILKQREPHLLCSADAIVFRTLGLLQRDELGISLEEILVRVGKKCTLTYQYTKKFRDHYTKEGQKELILGTALKTSPL